MSTLDLATWVTILGTWVLVVGTLTFAYWQMRQTQRINSAKTILDLRDRFDSPAMRATRREVSTQLLAGDPKKELENYDVGFFFQLMGSLTHERILDRRMVWNAFGGWVTGYHYALTHPVDRISRWRKETNDPTIFHEFEWLATEMTKLDHSAVRSPPGSDTTAGDARDVLESESQLVTRN
ncbi:MAG: hypothetical protein WA688_07725 [Thermoplasmata archaeon]